MKDARAGFKTQSATDIVITWVQFSGRALGGAPLFLGGHVNTWTFCILQPQMSTYFFQNTLLKKIKGTFWYHDLYWTLSLKEVPGLCQTHCNCFLNINDLSEVQLCMSSNSWTWECPHTKDGADHVPLIFLSSVVTPLKMYTHLVDENTKDVLIHIITQTLTLLLFCMFPKGMLYWEHSTEAYHAVQIVFGIWPSSRKRL